MTRLSSSCADTTCLVLPILKEGEKIQCLLSLFFLQIDSERKALSFNLQTQSRQTWRSLVSQKYHPRRHQRMDPNRFETNSYHYWHSHSGKEFSWKILLQDVDYFHLFWCWHALVCEKELFPFVKSQAEDKWSSKAKKGKPATTMEQSVVWCKYPHNGIQSARARTSKSFVTVFIFIFKMSNTF